MRGRFAESDPDNLESGIKNQEFTLRILFLVHNLGKTRHFEGVIRGLTARGHTVVVAAARKRKPLRPTKSLHDDPRVEVIACPTRRVDGWQDFALAVRRARDYVRFLDPRYARSVTLAARAADYAPDGWSSALDRYPYLRRHWRMTQRALALVEAVMPTERYFELFLKAERADLLLVTPLIDFGSYQTDYVKAAHRLGLPVAFLPFSWDNLTNRGLIRVAPDRVLVWNEHQRREAVELHGVPPDRVIVTGAPRFDEFFALRPATCRGRSFCTPALRTLSRRERWSSFAAGSPSFADPISRSCATAACSCGRTPRIGSNGQRRTCPTCPVWRSGTNHPK
jgi:hypothetical protein